MESILRLISPPSQFLPRSDKSLQFWDEQGRRAMDNADLQGRGLAEIPAVSFEEPGLYLEEGQNGGMDPNESKPQASS